MAQATPQYGTDVTNLWNNPTALGQTVELTAYFSGAGVPPMVEEFPVTPDQAFCPTYSIHNAILSDRPLLAVLRTLNGMSGNRPADDQPWLVAGTPEQTKPGAQMLAQLPYHARLRGYLGDPAFAGCPDAGRIFLVEQIEEIYTELPPVRFEDTFKLPADYSGWQRYHDQALGYSLPYPPGWQVETASSPDTIASIHLTGPDWPDFPVMAQVYAGEFHFDQYDPASDATLSRFVGQNQGHGIFSQGFSFNPADYRTAGLFGYEADSFDIQAGRGSSAVLFSGQGNTYKLAVVYPTGFEASQELLTIYTAMVEGFALDVNPGPTPSPPVKQNVGAGPFLTQAEVLARVHGDGDQPAELIEASLVSEAEARRLSDVCSTFMGHPDGVWVLVVREMSEGQLRTMRLFFEATTGEQLCGEEISP